MTIELAIEKWDELDKQIQTVSDAKRIFNKLPRNSWGWSVNRVALAKLKERLEIEQEQWAIVHAVLAGTQEELFR